MISVYSTRTDHCCTNGKHVLSLFLFVSLQIHDSLLQAFGVEHAVTSAYHPQSNGQDERTNQNIKRHLAKYCNTEGNDWDRYLQFAVYSINTSRQRSTKVSPYYALYGVHPYSRADPVVNDCEIEESEEVLQRRADLLADIHDKVQENIKIAQGRQKCYFEAKQKRKMKCFNVKEGEEVLLAQNRRGIKLGSGLKVRWIGPFRVESLTAKGMATLVDVEGLSKKRQKVNVRHVKPYLRRQNQGDDVSVTSEDAEVTVQCGPTLAADIASDEVEVTVLSSSPGEEDQTSDVEGAGLCNSPTEADFSTDVEEVTVLCDIPCEADISEQGNCVMSNTAQCYCCY